MNKKPTTICPADHRHEDAGTCYSNHKCRCDKCAQAWRDRNGRRRKDIAYGRHESKFTDAGPAREHVAELVASGMTLPRIARAAGLNTSTVCALLRGRSDRIGRTSALTPTVLRTTEAALLTVTASLDILGDYTPIDGLGVRRRIQALVARGWSLSAIGRHMGASPQRVEQMVTADGATPHTYRRVYAVYEALWNQQPPTDTPGHRGAIVRSLNRARRHGWAPPAAWDDIDTDRTPPIVERGDDIDMIAVDLAIAGELVHLNRAERELVITRLHALHWSDSRIAERADCEPRTVLRIRQDLHLEAFDQTDLIHRDAA